MAGYLSHCIAAVGSNAMPKSLFPVSNSDNSLRVAIPGEVIDPAVDNRVFTLGYPVSDTIPYSHYTGGITARNVESRGRKSCNCSLGFMFCVLGRDGGVVDRAQEDGFI